MVGWGVGRGCRTGSTVVGTARTCFHTKGTWLVSTRATKLRGHQRSSFFLFPSVHLVINVAASASVITPLCSDFLLCWTGSMAARFSAPPSPSPLSPRSPPPKCPSPPFLATPLPARPVCLPDYRAPVAQVTGVTNLAGVELHIIASAP